MDKSRVLICRACSDTAILSDVELKLELMDDGCLQVRVVDPSAIPGGIVTMSLHPETVKSMVAFLQQKELS